MRKHPVLCYLTFENRRLLRKHREEAWKEISEELKDKYNMIDPSCFKVSELKAFRDALKKAFRKRKGAKGCYGMAMRKLWSLRTPDDVAWALASISRRPKKLSATPKKGQKKNQKKDQHPISVGQAWTTHPQHRPANQPLNYSALHPLTVQPPSHCASIRMTSAANFSYQPYPSLQLGPFSPQRHLPLMTPFQAQMFLFNQWYASSLFWNNTAAFGQLPFPPSTFPLAAYLLNTQSLNLQNAVALSNLLQNGMSFNASQPSMTSNDSTNNTAV
ncbi:hypothetical protein L596_005951 [Steinernema carpocapsae]|uniref:MADF domain-containing protein n=1 Tax=Steinernema carpocapsae TaxID=34508 RepID=A0A4U8V0M2_STECR|nr:hypothetical protein L596_005951 [Steinernema carpocapsae]